MDGSIIVTKAPLDAEVPTLGLYGLNLPGTPSASSRRMGYPRSCWCTCRVSAGKHSTLYR